MKQNQAKGIQVRDGVGFIRNTRIRVVDLMRYCWDSPASPGCVYKHSQIVTHFSQFGLTTTDIDNARQYILNLLTGNAPALVDAGMEPHKSKETLGKASNYAKREAKRSGVNQYVYRNPDKSYGVTDTARFYPTENFVCYYDPSGKRYSKM